MILRTLTVQDVLWINLQVTKRVNHFHYAKLEEAVYYQYGYGQSTNLEQQAARFLTGFMKLSPIDEGVPATAFLSALVFLKINGKELALGDEAAPGWLEGILQGRTSSLDAIRLMAKDREHHGEDHGHGDGEPDIRAAVSEVIDAYPNTLKNLNSQVAA